MDAELLESIMAKVKGAAKIAAEVNAVLATESAIGDADKAMRAAKDRRDKQVEAIQKKCKHWLTASKGDHSICRICGRQEDRGYIGYDG